MSEPNGRAMNEYDRLVAERRALQKQKRRLRWKGNAWALKIIPAAVGALISAWFIPGMAAEVVLWSQEVVAESERRVRELDGLKNRISRLSAEIEQLKRRI